MKKKVPVQPRGFIARYQAWKNEQIQAIATQEEAIALRLLNMAPANLHPFLNEISAVKCLLEYGKKHTHFYPQEVVTQYGFRSFADFSRQMKVLAEAWEGVVSIRVGKFDDARKSLLFNVI